MGTLSEAWVISSSNCGDLAIDSCIYIYIHTYTVYIYIYIHIYIHYIYIYTLYIYIHNILYIYILYGFLASGVKVKQVHVLTVVFGSAS